MQQLILAGIQHEETREAALKLEQKILYFLGQLESTNQQIIELDLSEINQKFESFGPKYLKTAIQVELATKEIIFLSKQIAFKLKEIRDKNQRTK